jgi:hypothetical protein
MDEGIRVSPEGDPRGGTARPPYDPRRLRGPLVALVAVAVAMGASGWALSPAVAGRPRWLPEADSLPDAKDFTRLAGRLAGVAASAPKRLGLLLGPSALEWGVDPAGMPTLGDGPPMRWLRVYTHGISGEDYARMADLVVRAGVAPETTVVVVGPSALASRMIFLEDAERPDTAPLRKHLAARNLWLAKRDVEGLILVPWNRSYPNRSRIGQAFRRAVFRGRLDLFRALGYGLDVPVRPAADPWRDPLWWPPDRSYLATEDQQMAGLAKSHAFDAETYSPDSANARALAEMVRALREGGSDVVLVVPPEASRRRLAEPPEWFVALESVMRSAFGASAPPILDFRAAMPDDAFFDLSHLHAEGCAEFTRRLGEALRRARTEPPRP